jgi:hypothetical protein
MVIIDGNLLVKTSYHLVFRLPLQKDIIQVEHLMF